MPESLAVKYRPKDFDDGVCGQSSVVKILKNRLRIMIISIVISFVDLVDVVKQL